MQGAEGFAPRQSGVCGIGRGTGFCKGAYDDSINLVIVLFDTFDVELGKLSRTDIFIANAFRKLNS